MANTATIRNANGLPATFAGSKTGQDDAPFVFVKVGDEERRMRWAEWDALPAWTGPRPSRTKETNSATFAATSFSSECRRRTRGAASGEQTSSGRPVGWRHMRHFWLITVTKRANVPCEYRTSPRRRHASSIGAIGSRLGALCSHAS